MSLTIVLHVLLCLALEEHAQFTVCDLNPSKPYPCSNSPTMNCIIRVCYQTEATIVTSRHPGYNMKDFNRWECSERDDKLWPITCSNTERSHWSKPHWINVADNTKWLFLHWIHLPTPRKKEKCKYTKGKMKHEAEVNVGLHWSDTDFIERSALHFIVLK